MKSGLYWHVHHDKLVEWCYDYSGRVECILEYKPESERELRLRLFKPVKGKLGDAQARSACDQAESAYNQAESAREHAEFAYAQAGSTYLKTINPEDIATLHAEECPNCPWDGETIFPKEGK